MLLSEDTQGHPHLQSALDALADRIKDGIVRTGCYILGENELESVFHMGEKPEEEKRLTLENFASHYGFGMYLTPHVKVAVFKRVDNADRQTQK
jgi:hypothetical protein